MSLLGICPTLHCLLSPHFLVRLLTRSITFGNENGRLPAKVRKERGREKKRKGKKCNLFKQRARGAFSPAVSSDWNRSTELRFQFDVHYAFMALPGRPMFMYTSASMAMAVALE